MKIKVKYLVMTLATAFMIFGITYETSSATEYPIEKIGGGEYVLVDCETGVNYFIIKTNYGVAMSPRYNADGSLYNEKGETHD